LKTYRSIEFHPDMFADYLMSREVGFTLCERLRLHSRHCLGTTRTLSSSYDIIIVVNEHGLLCNSQCGSECKTVY